MSQTTLDWIDQSRFYNLVREATRGRLIAFVGSGASKAAGCPTWYQLLDEFLQTHHTQYSQWFRGLLASGEYLYLAEVLEDHFPGELVSHIGRRLTQHYEPSIIHTALTKVPFAQVLTTNYDLLLEQAYLKKRGPTNVRVWDEPLDILRDLRHGDFSITKLHGRVDRLDSIIRTKNDYVFLLHNNAMFQACLKALFLTKTLLFVGHSLRDFDLLSLLNEIAREYQKSALRSQPHYHYALLPQTEVNELSTRRLQEDYNILVFPYPSSTENDKTGQVERFLLRLADESTKAIIAAALRRKTDPTGAVLQDIHALLVDQGPLFVRNRALGWLIKLAVSATASLRGDVCLADETGTLEWPDPTLSTGPSSIEKPVTVNPDSVIGTTFNTAPSLQGPSFRQALDEFYIYISDVHDLSEIRESYPRLTYVICHPEVEGELAVKITSDGETVGVLNLEASRKEAYSSEHIQIAKDLARKAGWIYAAARDRNQRGDGLRALHKDPSSLTDFIHRYRGLEDVDGVIYVADFNIGKLQGNHCGGRGTIVFDFDSKNSFAVRVLREEVASSIDDLDAAIAQGTVDPEGVERFGITGRLFGTPVNVFGVQAGVVVAWSTKGSLEFTMDELIQCLVQLFVNDLSTNHSRSSRVLDLMMQVEDAPRQSLNRILMSAVRETGLDRARLWLSRGDHFECVASTGKDERDDQYSGHHNPVSGEGANIYCQLIRGRYLTDPHARIQKPTMYGPDPMAERLNKDPNGDWIVAPLVAKGDQGRNLIGYISADNHVSEDHKLELDRDNTFILRALDAIAIVAARTGIG